ncbi:MAG: AraC family transcriptional regulator [Myxococcota bacterium]|nr:AraC family transcriptional regulator [Myxococcota bacterium]
MSTPPEARIAAEQPEEFASELAPFAAELVSIEPLRSRGFHATARAWSLGDVRMFQVAVGQARVSAPPPAGVVSLSMPLNGTLSPPTGARTHTFEPGTCLVRDDARAMEVVVKGSSVLVSNIDTTLLCETAGKLAGAGPPERFRAEPMLSLSSPAGARFWRCVTSIWQDLKNDAPWLRSEGLAAEARSGLAEALIDATAPGGSQREPACGPAALRRAEEFILAHLADPVSRADVCAAAATSERSLSRAFERRHGVGPMTFLRQRRLDAAHRLLLAADPAESQVTSIAMECGLHHLGRFAVEYRRAFGESPSETLRG